MQNSNNHPTISHNLSISSNSSINDDEVINSLKENKLEKKCAAKLNRKILEKNIPKAISEISNYLDVLKNAFSKVCTKKQIPKKSSQKNSMKLQNNSKRDERIFYLNLNKIRFFFGCCV